MRKRRHLVWAAVAVTFMALTGCTDYDADDSGSDEPTPADESTTADVGDAVEQLAKSESGDVFSDPNEATLAEAVRLTDELDSLCDDIDSPDAAADLAAAAVKVAEDDGVKLGYFEALRGIIAAVGTSGVPCQDTAAAVVTLYISENK